MAESVNTGKVQISEFRFLQTDVKLKVFVFIVRATVKKLIYLGAGTVHYLPLLKCSMDNINFFDNNKVRWPFEMKCFS